MTLRCEDGNSKLVEVFTVADVDSEDHVDIADISQQRQHRQWCTFFQASVLFGIEKVNLFINLAFLLQIYL